MKVHYLQPICTECVLRNYRMLIYVASLGHISAWKAIYMDFD